MRLQGLLDDDLWLDYIGDFLLLDGRCTLDGSRALFQNTKILVDFSLPENLVHDGPSGLHIRRVEGLAQSLGTCVVNRTCRQSLCRPCSLMAISALGWVCGSWSLD